MQEGLRSVADGGEVRDAQFVANALDDAEQSRLFDPYFRPVLLTAP
jgi:hypothetical protein